MKREASELEAAATRLAAYIDSREEPAKLERKRVMELVHELNTAYFRWADGVDSSEFWE